MKLREEAYKLFRLYGRRLTEKGYAAGHGGNMSIRAGSKIYITRHGCTLEDIKPEDVIEVSLHEVTSFDAISSTETVVHREVYLQTQNLAVMHAHSPYAIAISFFTEKMKPIDAEASHILREVPIVEGRAGSEQLAKKVAAALKEHHAVIVRGHGTFTAAQTLEQAYRLICMVERSAQQIYLTEILKRLGFEFIKPKEI
ncbi:MAG: class II aldolase/adducin family protein [archaeon GB-1867-005]|nr:class II aldolase/adducin family protein [Candidatus Culexmicrobium cathedralense]